MLLVTGASGFVGSHVVRRAAADGAAVRGLVRRRLEIPGVETVVGDLGDQGSLERALAGVDTIVHAAAITANLKPRRGESYDSVNRAGTSNLVAAARSAGVRRIVLVSGLGTTRAPSGTYMATRWEMEEAVRGAGLDYVILQPSVLFGDNATFVTALADLVRRSPVVPLLGRRGLRFQPLWIEDLATCILAAARGDITPGATIPLGGPEILTFKQVMEAIASALHKRRLLLPVPLWAARVPVSLMARILPSPPLTAASLELFEFDNATVPDAVERAFHFRPRGFREHLARYGVTG